MQLTNPAIRIRTSQVEPLGNTLARCFYDDPGVAYILPDPHVRRVVLLWFFTSVAIRTSRRPRLANATSPVPSAEGFASRVVPVVEGAGQNDKPRWSPDGNLCISSPTATDTGAFMRGVWIQSRSGR